jgi:uncharacterized protein
MLAIPLAALEQEGALEIQAAIPPDDACWEGTEFRFSTPLSVMGRALWVQSGEVLVRVRLEGRMAQDCRRCLEPVEVPVQEELDLLFAPVDEGEEDESARPLPVGQTELDLAEALREEVILSQSTFALCTPDCKGLCPQCGVNLNEEQCQCSVEESDPRWDALRTLKEERE